MKKLFSLNNLKHIANWIWLGRFHLLTFLAFIITILYIIKVFYFLTNFVAAIFSIIGLSIILRQLLLDASQFADQRPNTIHNWIKDFPTGKPLTVYAESGVFVASMLKARGTVSISANATIDTKVDFLMKQINNIQDEIANVDNRVDDVNASLTNKTKEINANLENLNKSLKTIIAGHAVGDYDVNLFGIVITISGVLIQLFYSLRT